MASFVSRLMFGDVPFPESEEYQEFRYKFLIVLMVSAALCTLIFIVADAASLNPIQGWHSVSMRVFTVSALVLWGLLRGRKQAFLPVAIVYELICLAEYTSAWVFVPQDELRLLWFFVNIPGVFILLGQRWGWATTLLTAGLLVLGNSHVSPSYSPNALATAVLSMIYLGVFFHAYGDRSMSYFTRMRQYNLRLQEMATHDALTGVLNARAYGALCDQHIRVAQREASPYAVLFIDLDHFKKINDTHGHAAGDVVLKTVANTIAQGIRASDALGRIGGEEFSVFLPHTDLPGALRLAETLRQSVEACQPRIDALTIHVTASIGVACNATGTMAMHELQQQADQAMYQAKAAGRNRVSTLQGLGAQGKGQAEGLLPL